jgi:hypothetical protein
MIQPINNINTNLTNSSPVQSPVSQDKTCLATEESIAGEIQNKSAEGIAKADMSADGDTVEISEKGMSQVQSQVQSTSCSASTASAEESTTTGGATGETADAELVSSDDSEDASDLSQYSEYQLKQMLAAGNISKAEYDAEIKRRHGNEESAGLDGSSEEI